MRPTLTVGTNLPSMTLPLPPQKSPLNTNKPYPPTPLPSHDFDLRPRSSSLSDNQHTSKPLPTLHSHRFADEPVGRASLDSRRPSEPSTRLGRTPQLTSSSSIRSPSISDQSRSHSPLPPSPHRPHPPPPQQSRSGSSSSSSNLPLRSNASFVSTHTTRTALNPYDSRLLNSSFATLPPLPAAPSALNPHPTPDPSSSSQQVYPHPSHPTSALSTLFLHILPLFNGSPLHSPLEDLNALVSTHIKSTLSRLPNNPSRAVDLLTNDLRELIASGMLTLDQKVQGVEDGKLVARIVSIWTFFLSGVVPYVEGVFLPLGTVSRGGGSSRGGAGSAFLTSPDATSSSSTPPSDTIDVRLHLLTSFLLSIFRPLLPRVVRLLADPADHTPPTPEHLGKLQQLVLILLTQADPDVVGQPGETGDGFQREGLEGLLRAVGRAREGGTGEGGGTRFSGGVDKTDRRGGWIAGKHRRRPTMTDQQQHLSYDWGASETPTGTFNSNEMLRLPSNYSSTSESNSTATRPPRPLPRHLQQHGGGPESSISTTASSLFSPLQNNFSSTTTTTLTQHQQPYSGGGSTPRQQQMPRRGVGTEEQDETAYLDSLRSPEIRSPAGSSGSGERRHSSPVF